MLNLELKELNHFISVVNYGGFSKAAEHTYVSQPTLSKSIKKLESELDIKLFQRSTRELILTDAGSTVYKQALKIIGTTDELFILLDDLASVPKGEISIGVPPLIGALFFPHIAYSFTKLYPHITLTLIEHGAKKIESLVDEGKVDIGIVVSPSDENKFNHFPFREEDFALFINKKNHLADKKIIHLNELREESFILFNPEFSLHDLIIRHCQNAGFNPIVAYKSSQWDLITELVNVNLGMTILPYSVSNKMNTQKIKVVPLNQPPVWKLNLITKKDSYHSFSLKALVNFLTNEFQLSNH